MTLQECYEKMGGDYEDLCKRLGGPTIAARFPARFLDDTSYQDLKEAIDKKDWEAAFRAAHTLKGVAANLSMTSINEPASAITEELRGGNALKSVELCGQLDEAYEKTIQCLKEFSKA